MKTIQNPDERVMVFIDLRNVEESKKDVYGEALADIYHVDYEKMVDKIVGDRRLVGAYVFDGIFDDQDFHSSFYNKFRFQGFTVDLRRNSTKSNGQKGVDVSLAVQAVRHAYMDHYDTAIIVSGDSDFVPAIESIRDAGKNVECVSSNGSTSPVVKMSVTKWTNIHELDVIDYDDKRLKRSLEEYENECSDKECDEIAEMEE